MMDVGETISKLDQQVTAIKEEFEKAIQFHATWSFAAGDHDLHARMSNCYEGNAFLIVRSALRREVLLALMRIWDKQKYDDPIRLTLVRDWLRDDNVISELALRRSCDVGLLDEAEEMRKELEKLSQSVIRLISKFLDSDVLKRAKRLRDTQLAHRQVRPVPIPSSEDFDQKVEEFFRETSVLVNGLMSLVQGVAYDLSEAAEVYAFYAKCFWTTVGKKSMAPCDAEEPGKVSGTELAPGNSA